MVQKNSRPNHPTTCGKAERFQQTMKKWLRAQPDQPTTIGELQALLDLFADRVQPPPTTPVTPPPGDPGDALQRDAQSPARPTTDTDTHDRIRHDRVDNAGSVTLRTAGRLHHIGVGRTHAGTRVILLVQDLHVRVVNAVTGELLRDLIIDPTATTSPRSPKGPRPRNEQHPNLHSQVRVSPMS